MQFGIGRRLSLPGSACSPLSHWDTVNLTPTSVPATPRSLLLHCQVFWPDNTATSQMITAVAEDAAAAGWRVMVVTSAKGYNLEETYPVFERHAGVDIHRVSGAQFDRHNIFGRLANWVSFIIFSGWKLLTLSKSSCLVVTSSPPLSICLAWLLFQLRQIPFVFVSHDLYPEIAIASGILRSESSGARLANWLFGCWMSRAAAVIVLGDCMKRRMLAAHPRIQLERVLPIDNWHDGELLFPLARQTSSGATVCFQYSGNLGAGHEFETLLAAMNQLKGRIDLRFQFVGRGKKRPQLEANVQQFGIGNCTFHDYVPEEELNRSLNQADVCLVTLAQGFEGLIVPSKIYGIMAVGKPVLYIGPLDGEVPTLVHQHQLGWVVEQGNVTGLVCALEEATGHPELREIFGSNARRAFDAHYDRPLATKKYIEVFDSVARSGNDQP